jgi:hypothetical protein
MGVHREEVRSPQVSITVGVVGLNGGEVHHSESSETVGSAAQAAKATGVPLVVTRPRSPGLDQFRAQAREATRQRLLRELWSWAQLAVDLGLRPLLVLSEGDAGTAVLE